jgi:hypothetical protein
LYGKVISGELTIIGKATHNVAAVRSVPGTTDDTHSTYGASPMRYLRTDEYQLKLGETWLCYFTPDVAGAVSTTTGLTLLRVGHFVVGKAPDKIIDPQIFLVLHRAEKSGNPFRRVGLATCNPTEVVDADATIALLGSAEDCTLTIV